jgi:spermidine synthase
VFALLCILFFLSGACALVYQVMWLRLLSLVFGVTVYAASTVLASFMAGLALGSFVAGRSARRIPSPLLAFGIVEILIGVSALATPLVLDAVKNVWVVFQPTLPSSLVFITVARFVVAFIVLIVPTTLMGATLPIVMRSALVTERAVASRIGLLYAVNTMGAIAGALTAGFYLVPHIGISRSFQIAALTNTAVGIMALIASLTWRARSSRLEGSSAEAPAAEPLTEGQRQAVLWTFILSGLMSLALEIVWFRMLAILLRPTAYAFTIMLAAVLAGIALGSAIAAPLLRRQRPWLMVLTQVQLLISLAAVLSLNALVALQAVGAWLRPFFTALGLDPYLAPIVVSSMLAILPTALLLGFAFPIGLWLWTGTGADSTRRIGLFYSLNVVGAIAGSVVGGFLLLPALGSRGGLIAASACALVSSVWLAARQWRTTPNFAGFTLVVGPVAFAMAALNVIDPFAITETSEQASGRLLWRREGPQTTVAIHERGRDRPTRSMLLDGMHQASDSPAMIFVHHRIGAMPVMLHPSPREALVVGLGGGATAGAVARFPGLNVDVVELSRDVVAGASFFEHINFQLLRRPNVRLRVDDGRNYLLTTRKRYDVITADVILPRNAGASSVYSREYFQLVRNALNNGGLALQWNGADTDTTYRLILRTFLSVFPHTTLWGDGTLMLGSVEPFTFSRSAYEARRQNPEFRGLFDWPYETIMKTYVAGPPDVANWVGEGPILTDDRPVVEYFLSLPRDEPPPDFNGLRGRPSDVMRP